MPILSRLQAVQIHVDGVVFCVGRPLDQGLPAAIAPTAWGIAPGILKDSPEEQRSGHADLQQRLRQAGIQFVPARFVLPGKQVDGCILLAASRDRAIRLAYKLGEWAVFHIVESGVRVVYSGFNSRSR
jgi:hypothetical protein